MITSTKKKLLMATLVASLGFAASAQAQVQPFKEVVVAGKGEIPYVIDARNVVTRSGYDLCWRTGYWTPAAAESALTESGVPLGCECDPEIVAKDKCSPAVPAAKGPVASTACVPSKVKLNADSLFDFNKAVLRPAGKAELDNIVAKANSLKLEAIVVVGHTDRLGSDKYNQKLSESRAAAVKNYLVSKGLKANQIYAEGKGEKMPTKDTAKCTMKPESSRNKALVACLQPDRRVEVEVVGLGECKK